MNRNAKKNSVILATLILILPLLLLCPIGTLAASDEPTRVAEIAELKNRNSNTYQLSNGDCEWVGYMVDVNYLDHDGKYRSIDNSVINEIANINNVNYLFRNAANSYTVRYADNAANAYIVNMEYQGKSVSFGLMNAQTTNAEKIEKPLNNILAELIADTQASVEYKDVYPGIDIIYESKEDSIKEYIVLNQPTDKSEFDFTILLNGLSVKDDNGSIVFVDKEGKGIFNLGSMYAIDNNGVQTRNIKCTFEKTVRQIS